jgi:hypothetical protein
MTPPARCCRLEDKVSTVPKPKREPLLADKYLATRRWKWVPKQFDGTTRDEDQARRRQPVASGQPVASRHAWRHNDEVSGHGRAELIWRRPRRPSRRTLSSACASLLLRASPTLRTGARAAQRPLGEERNLERARHPRSISNAPRLKMKRINVSGSGAELIVAVAAKV